MNKAYSLDEYVLMANEANKTGQKLYRHRYYSNNEEFVQLILAPPNYYICYEDNYTDGSVNSHFDEQNAQNERKRLDGLSITRGDVFRALLKAKGVTRTQLRTAIETNETLSDVERELALIDFDEALEFFRGVDLINILGASLGITKEQLDEFFETNDYTKLMPPAESNDVSEPVENVNTY